MYHCDVSPQLKVTLVSDPPGPKLPEALRHPHPERLPLEAPDRVEILAAHDSAVDAGAQGYLDPRSGLFVLTAETLWERGSCCEQGCRHCPWLPRP